MHIRNFEEFAEDPLIAYEPSSDPVEPEVEVDVAREPLPPESHFRKISRKIGATVAAAVLSVAALASADVASGHAAYPDNETTVTTVAGSETASPDAETYLVFGGLGQANSATAAAQFLKAKKDAGENVKAASIHYKNQGIDASDANAIESYLEDNHVKHLGIVGVSMGTPTALELLYDIRAKKTPEWKIKDIVAYSSPADRFDPWQANLLHEAAQVDYPGGMLSKYMYNLNPEHLLSDSPDERKAQIKHANEQTFNDCSPALYMSQVKLLDTTDIDKWEQFKDTFENSAAFTFLKGGNPDNTVDVETAIAKYYRDFKQKIGMTWQTIEVEGAGHADTARSALALEEADLARIAEELKSQLFGENGSTAQLPQGVAQEPRYIR